MKIRYSQKSGMYASLYMIISALCIFFTFFSDGVDGYLSLSIAVTIEICFFIIFIKKTSGQIISFATIFVLILAVFHFGQVFICGYWGELITELKLRIVLKYFTDAECISAMRIVNISFVGICLGLLLSSEDVRDCAECEIEKGIENSVWSEKHALYLIAFTFPIKVIVDSIFFYLSFTTGFLPAIAWLGKFPDFIRTIGDLSMIGFGVLIAALSYDRTKQLRVYVFITAYLVIQIISGRRSETVAYIAIQAFLFFKFREHKKRKIGSIILLVALGYLLLTLMYTTVRIRSEDIRTLESFMALFWKLLTKHNIFMEAIREYGNTGYTPVCVLSNWLNHYNPSYGKSYLLGISAIFPNIGGGVSRLINASTYAIQLQNYNMVQSGFKNIGGSVIGELFFNFGITGGLIASPILGGLIGKVSRKVDLYTRTMQVQRMAFYIPAMYAILYWVRDCFGDGIREVAWGILMWYLVGFIRVRSISRLGSEKER